MKAIKDIEARLDELEKSAGALAVQAEKLEARLRGQMVLLQAWKPVVEAAVEWNESLRANRVEPISGPIRKFADAVEALPIELRP